MAGINGWEALVLLLLVLLVVGPDKLPEVAGQVARWLRTLREFLRGAREQVSRELGDDLDLGALDLRQYDPRRAVSEALFEPLDAPSGPDRSSTPGPAARPGHAPFDEEAT